MELMDLDQKREFLEQNKSPKLRTQMLTSLSLKEYLGLLESKFTVKVEREPLSETELVERYMKLVEQNKHSVSVSFR